MAQPSIMCPRRGELRCGFVIGPMRAASWPGDSTSSGWSRRSWLAWPAVGCRWPPRWPGRSARPWISWSSASWLPLAARAGPGRHRGSGRHGAQPCPDRRHGPGPRRPRRRHRGRTGRAGTAGGPLPWGTARRAGWGPHRRRGRRRVATGATARAAIAVLGRRGAHRAPRGPGGPTRHRQGAFRGRR